ncbi:hypothetical protein [Aurantiacibacter marinus]|uniref:hypothetical protein n=1 Tax=Aurantiacibacter marinus TaxID=874156 RepID=UPI00069B31BA|nr:hypothetical protein [Aurantiacibacter marinus]
MFLVSGTASAQQTNPLTCWYNDSGQYTGADTGNPAGISRANEIRQYRTGDYAFGLRLDIWQSGNDCPATIEFSPDLEPAGGGLDWTLPATFGSVKLVGGNLSAPNGTAIEQLLTAGGSIAAGAATDAECYGMIARAPDYDVYYDSTRSRTTTTLMITTLSQADTTLVINGPNGEWYCDDDSGGSFNAHVAFAAPVSGLYNIWVGTFDSSTAPATLVVSEARSR